MGGHGSCSVAGSFSSRLPPDMAHQCCSCVVSGPVPHLAALMALTVHVLRREFARSEYEAGIPYGLFGPATQDELCPLPLDVPVYSQDAPPWSARVAAALSTQERFLPAPSVATPTPGLA